MITMMATAPQGELNHSNNSTYLEASQDLTGAFSGKKGYKQKDLSSFCCKICKTLRQ